MRLQTKFTLYNILTKVAIILSVAVLFILTIEKVAYNHLDARLLQKKQRFISHLSSKEISEYISEQDTNFASYNVLKEEYILLTPVNKINKKDSIGNFTSESRIIENETNTYRILTYNFDFNAQEYQLEIGESLASIKQFKSSLSTYTSLILVVAILLTLISDFLFTGFLLKPLLAIINKRLKNVTDPTHFNYETIKTSTNDFQHLDKQLREMLQRIEHSFYTQKEFIANVSHELLTPISILKNRFENLLNEKNINEDIQNQIFSSLNTLHWLKNIVNSLLLISKIENEQFQQNEEISILPILKQIKDEMEYRLDEKSIDFTINLKHVYSFTGNQALIRTMLLNVIANAIKYNNDHGQINLSDALFDSYYRLSINDTGKGIKPEQIKAIFNRFEKVDSSDENSYGLGLAIVQSIANFHKIHIDIESVWGQGTTLHFNFPKH